MAEVIRLEGLLDPVPVVFGIVSVGMLWGIAVGESPALTIAAGIIIISAFVLLWRPGEPPTLLLLAVIHLVQVTTALIYANVTGVHINSISEYGVDLETATFTALGGVLCLIIGMSLGSGRTPFWSPEAAQSEAAGWSEVSAFRFFLVTLGIELFFTELSSLSEGVRQLFLAGAGIQWIGLYLLVYVCLSQNRGYGYLLTGVGIELALGFTGFFSDFKQVFFVLFVAAASAKPKLNLRSFAALIVTAVCALVLSAFWSAIKTDYREFLNKGSNAQEVLVPLDERFSFLADRVSEADGETLSRGFDLLFKRMSYVEFFGATLAFVPDGRPHENGAMTAAAISHIFLPRLLFPDKAPLPDDTAVTVAYTGLPMTLRTGVSISIGYAGELYIDFGVLGMMACMGMLGFFYGWASQFIQQHFSSALIAYGATIPLLMPGFLFETSLPKVLGAVCTSFIILLLMAKIVVPFALNALAWKSRESVHRAAGAG